MVMRFPVAYIVLVATALILPSGFARGSRTAQQPSPQEQSLGEKARKLKAQQASQSKPVKVFTNDNIPSGSGGITVIGAALTAPGAPSRAAEEGSEHGERYYRKAMGELQAKLDLHQRQLAVLQQQLNINQLQYYPDPNKTLQQEYSRSDIDKLHADIEAKQQEIKADEQAISDLTAQLRREGGEPGWLRLPPTGQAGLEKQESKEREETAKGKPGTREYWQSRFKSARARLAKAQEAQQLAEDELNLLQVRQAREVLNTDTAGELVQKVAAKQVEVDSARIATQEATQAIEELKREFASSGAPEEWSSEQ